MKSDSQILSEIRSAANGLTVMSESDYPFELIRWDGKTALTPEYLREFSDRDPNCAVEVVELNTFLGADERFRQLQAVLQNNLEDVKVFKVGEINIPVYVVGRSPEGNWLGVSTRLIQT